MSASVCQVLPQKLLLEACVGQGCGGDGHRHWALRVLCEEGGPGGGGCTSLSHPFRCSRAPGPVMVHALSRDLGFGVCYGSSETEGPFLQTARVRPGSSASSALPPPPSGWGLVGSLLWGEGTHCAGVMCLKQPSGCLTVQDSGWLRWVSACPCRACPCHAPAVSHSEETLSFIFGVC